MAAGPRMTPQTIAVLRVLYEDPATPRYGLDIARETGLKTGTLHPILARLQQAGWITSFWEDPADHEDQGRPRRRYYRFTGDGADVVRGLLLGGLGGLLDYIRLDRDTNSVRPTGRPALRVASRLLPHIARDEHLEEWTMWMMDLRTEGTSWPRRLVEVVSIMLVAAPCLAVTLRLNRRRAMDR
jgi:PadR family transcriptional regulator, regulatory protein PadR